MRVSTEQIYSRGIDSIQDVLSQTQKTQQQLSSGKKILTPADDPVASTRILELKQELSLNQQFQRNIDLVKNSLNSQDDLLGSADEVITRVRELTVQAGNGALSPDDLRFIAAEIKERLEQMAGILNTKDAGGESVFSGFQGDSTPFVKNSSGAYVYQGDEGNRFVQIEASVSIVSTINGKDTFVDVPVANNTFTTSASPLNQANPPAQITSGQVIDQTQYDAFYPNDMTVVFNPLTNVVPNGPNFNVVDSATGRVLLSNVNYTSGDPIAVNGIQFEVVGAPVPGDAFFVNSSEKQGVLTTMEKLIYGLEHFNTTTSGRAAFQNLLDDTMVNLDNAETSILETRAQIGARLNTVDTTDEQLKDVEILNKDILSTLEDIDYADAISLLSLQQTTLEAAYSSFSQLTSLNLFDRL